VRSRGEKSEKSEHWCREPPRLTPLYSNVCDVSQMGVFTYVHTYIWMYRLPDGKTNKNFRIFVSPKQFLLAILYSWVSEWKEERTNMGACVSHLFSKIVWTYYWPLGLNQSGGTSGIQVILHWTSQWRRQRMRCQLLRSREHRVGVPDLCALGSGYCWIAPFHRRLMLSYAAKEMMDIFRTAFFGHV
jgi:hypothetical protein